MRPDGPRPVISGGRHLVVGIADMCRGRPPEGPRHIHSIVEHAVGLGLALIDTADAYAPGGACFGYGESVLAPMLRDHDELVVMTKNGHTRGPDNSWGVCGDPDYLRAACQASLTRLGLTQLSIYAVHRPDPKIDFARSLIAVRSLLHDGLIRSVVLSNVDDEQLAVGLRVLGPGLLGVQNELSFPHRGDRSVLSMCESESLVYFAYAPFGGASATTDLRRTALRHTDLTTRHRCSPHELALAWLYAQSPRIVPVVGVSRPGSLDSCVRAMRVVLSTAEAEQLTE